MADESFVVWPDHPTKPARRGFASAGTRGRALKAQWIDKDGNRIGRPLSLEAFSERPVEAPGNDGGFSWNVVQAPIVVQAEPPAGAAQLQVRHAGRPLATIDVVEARRSRQTSLDAEPLILGNGDARWRLAFVAERFDDKNRFFAAVREFWDALISHAPFNQLDDQRLIGGFGLFWRSDPKAGKFGATDDKRVDRRLFGAEDLVIRAVASTGINPTKTMVLVNSPFRAGAGGFGNERPSWTTITSEGTELWTSVGLHELGHAFGLADEYSTEWVGDTDPEKLEPNITRQPDCRACEWKDLVTVMSADVPTFAGNDPIAFAQHDVGTFEGARYRVLGRYRPSPDCLMRTTGKPFCRVCSDHIVQEIMQT